MKIKTLFTLFTFILIFLMGAVGLWQVADSRAKIQAVTWLEKSNQLVNGIHSASAEIAVERGLTSSFLAQASHELVIADYWLAIQAQQSMVDSQLEKVITLLDQLIEIAPSQALLNYQQQLNSQLSVLNDRRQQVLETVTGSSNKISVQLWITEMTYVIEVLHGIASVSMLPIEGNIYSYASYPVVQDVFFTLSEYLGRQRASLAAALTSNAPLSQQEIKQLESYQSVAGEAYNRFLFFIQHIDNEHKSNEEILHLEANMQAFNALKNKVLQQSQNNGTYAVSVEEWFLQATETIQSVQKNSFILKESHEHRINLLRLNAEQEQWLIVLVFILFILGFSVASYMLGKRILVPLAKLKQAANDIALNNLENSFSHCCDDEVGQLGQAFENMRLQLATDKELRMQHEQERKKLYTALDQSIVAVVITDELGRVEYINQPYTQSTGYETDEIVGKTIDIWRLEAKSVGHYQDLINNLKLGKSWTGELLNKRKNGGLYWALTSVSPVFNAQGEVSHYIDIHLDISENKRVAQRLDFISYYDQTTSLPNRRFLSRHFEQIGFQHTNRMPLALASLTIGRLKQINDSMGWQFGDQVLREVGIGLKKQVSVNDIVAHQEGGKFAILLSSFANEAELRQQLENIVTILTQTLVVQNQPIQLSPNIGVGVYSQDCHNFETLLKRANIALHYAEQSSVDSLCFFEPEMTVSTKQKMAMEGALCSALKNEELELYYQPKVNIKTGRVYSVEALLRWYDKTNNAFIAPDIFIPLAEENGLIFSLGDWVLEQACKQVVQWGQKLNVLTVAVNLSAEQLKHPDFLHKVEQILKKTGASAEQIEFELTESVLMENPEQAMNLLSRLKNMGFRLAIDDFGTGYSSLSYLSHLPVDYLKIDRSFIKDITLDVSAATIATSIIALGHRMGLKIIAEGVETKEQLNYLKQYDCDYMQGYYYSRPLPAEQLMELLQQTTTTRAFI